MNKTKLKSKRNLINYPLFYLFLVVILGTFIGGWKYYSDLSTKFRENPPTLSITKPSTEKIASQVTLPVTLNLKVPYAPQAPFGNWKVHEESCEEAALTMYHQYLDGNKLDEVMEEGPLDLTYRDMKSWQVSHYGAERDLTMDALGKFAHDYYGFSYHVSTNITENDIKTAIYDGSPVVVPVMTHSLQNNMYGPYTVYHVLLVKGYDTTGVITNDAGVGNGQNHHYNWDILWQAIDAQTSKMSQGRTMLTLSK